MSALAPAQQAMLLVRPGIVPGTRLRLPAGTLYRSMHPRVHGVVATRRAATVTVHHVLDGSVQRWDEPGLPRGTVLLPQVVWVGSGGYWHRAQVTTQLLETNELAPLVLPELDVQARYDLGLDEGDETLPSLEDGYTNRWQVGQR